MPNDSVLVRQLEERVADLRFKTYQTPFNADSFFWTEFTPREGFSDVEEYRRYLSRLGDVPRYFDEHMANMRAGLARGYSVPRVALTGRAASPICWRAGSATRWPTSLACNSTC